ncbi:hypothetical protein VaNZ11_011815 [Volvox africanus]|uniref:Uncharacterized protein n=1 Tax=Volvox africanus TaxID=51714 RepID=A0ABQ5SE20_9CHLO|nr:hypothetical protein VaNZ11_011815 [Volvox africanus]
MWTCTWRSSVLGHWQERTRPGWSPLQRKRYRVAQLPHVRGRHGARPGGGAGPEQEEEQRQLSTCYGWWTGRRQGSEVRQGRSRRLQPKHLWAEGDSLILSLDAAKHPSRPTRPDPDGGVGGGGGDYGGCAGPASVATLSLTNTQTTTRLQIDILPVCLGEYDMGVW